MSQDSVKSLFTQCNAVVLPVSFAPEFTAMSRLNIATKLSELCASGRPILAIGPADAAMISGLQERNAAVCITELSVQAAIMGIRTLFDICVCKEVVANAQRYFKEYLNIELMRGRWSRVRPWLLDKTSVE